MLQSSSLTELQARLTYALAERYAVDREIGRGGMAVVFLARDVRHDRAVAIKVLRPEIALAVSAARFLREIRIAAQLQHPHILPLYDSGESEGLLFYVMPHVGGETLRRRLNREKQLPVPEALAIAAEVAETLAFAHSKGVVHRDIKPENILLAGGHALVLDFGIAHAVSAAEAESLTDSGVAIGTPHYMSPEQCSGAGTVDGRSDQYSLACVTFEMLAGEPPFTGPTSQAIFARHLQERPPSLEIVRPGLPAGLEATVRRGLAKVPADRFATCEALARALTAQTGPPAGHSASRFPWPRTLLLTIVVGGLATAVLRWVPKLWRVGVDPSLIAVAPFDALDSDLMLWREGLVDVLSRNLDGAGPLRTVSPMLVVRRWKGRAEPAAARRLGRETGAGVVLFGNLMPSGADSVRLSATIFDVGGNRSLGEMVLRDAVARLDRLSDSVTMLVLNELGRTRVISAVRVASAIPTSLPALRALLRGEQHFRRTAWDSALVWYQAALQRDSALALAYLRLSLIAGWQREDSLSRAYALLAAARNRRLAPRDSLMIAAQALLVQAQAAGRDPRGWDLRRRLHATLERASNLYPRDPEVWVLIGEARFSTYGVRTKALEAFDRAIELDSAFAPAYIRPIEVAALVRGVDAARRYVDAYLALKPVDVHAEGFKLARDLLGFGAGSVGSERFLEPASANVLYHAIDASGYWPDSGETVVRLAKRFASDPSSPVPLLADPEFRRYQLSAALAFRGHLREAYATFGNDSRYGYLLAGLAMLGAVPGDTFATALDRRARSTRRFPSDLAWALPWWAANGDSTALRRAVDRADSAVSSGGDADFASYLAGAGRAWLPLTRGDTVEALRRLRALPDTVCVHPCRLAERMVTARLLRARGALPEAAAMLDAEATHYNPIMVVWWFERARLADQLGDRAGARARYEYVSRVWANGDASLLPVVGEARSALRRLSGDRPSP